METNTPHPPEEPQLIRANDTSHRERSCWRAMRWSIIQQVIAFVIGALMLDGGDILHLCIIAILISWAPIVVIVCRQATHRDYSPSNMDLAIIKHCFWVFFVGMCLLYYGKLLPDRFYFVNRIRMKMHRPPAAANEGAETPQRP